MRSESRNHNALHERILSCVAAIQRSRNRLQWRQNPCERRLGTPTTGIWLGGAARGTSIPRPELVGLGRLK